MKKNQKIYLGLGLAVIVIIFIVLNASSLMDRFRGTPPGDIQLVVPIAQSTVYMDGKLLQTSATRNQTLDLKDISASKDHTIIVSKDGYWPWAKTIQVRPGKELDLAAFNEVNGGANEPLKPGTAEYTSAAAALAKAAAPTKAAMVLSPSKLVGIWAEGNNIKAEWLGDGTPDDFFCVDRLCEKDTTIFKGTSPVHSLAFYPNRDDLLLFATGNGVYAIEIDRTGTQNFQPVYTGTSPVFAPSSDSNFIYVKDQGKILKALI